MKYLYIFFLLALVVLSCNNSENNIDRGDYAFRFEKLVVLAPDEADSVTIGRIIAMTTGKNSELYVLDNGLMQVLKFANDGSVTPVLKLSEGRGPGEFLNPIDIAVDSLKNIYVLGLGNSKISVFDDTGLLDEIILDNRPAQMVVDENQDIYTLGFPFSYEGSVIHKYSRVDGGRYQRVKRFGDRPEAAKSRIVQRTGNTDNLAYGQDGNVYLSFFYPYEIRKYSKQGELLATMNRNDTPFSKPELSSKGTIVFDGGSWGVLTLKDNITISRVLEVGPENEWNLSLDFFKDGAHQETVTDSVLGIPDRAQYIVSDKYNTIYAGSNSPRPQIVKLVLE